MEEIGKRSEQFPTEGEAPIIDLNDEILVEILIKLGCCKVATQCKCVCKRWLGLISDHYFILRFRQQNHSHSHSHSHGGLAAFFASRKLPKATYFRNLSRLGFRGFHFKDIHERSFNVLAIYRDLVLLSHKRESDDDDVYYYVCNPRTKQWVTLPPCPWFKGSVLFGFICDYEGDDRIKIKVLRLLLMSKSYSKSYYKVNIFSSDIGQWRELKYSNLYRIPIPIPYPHPYHADLETIPGLTHTVACNGTIFLRDHMKRLIGFNAVEYQFHLIDLPSFPFIDSVGIKDMGVCRGKLRICQWTDDHICIWELESLNTNRWLLVHNLYFNELNTRLYRPFQAVDFHPNDGDIVHLHIHRRLVYPCNLREKKIGLEIDIPTQFSSIESEPLIPGSWVPPGAYFLEHRLWPTPLPPILHSNSNHKNKKVFLPEMVLTSHLLQHTKLW